MPRRNGALYKGLYYWMLEPAVLLMITGLAFALLGLCTGPHLQSQIARDVNEWLNEKLLRR